MGLSLKSSSNNKANVTGKRARISQAEEYMIFAVFGASAVLGVAVSLVMRFTKQIAFNTSVIAAEEQSIVAYSDVIKNTGVCKKPKGTIYSDAELNRCNPADITVSEIPNTLRANIIDNLSMNQALNSVGRSNSDDCYNSTTKRAYTLEELKENYAKAEQSGNSAEIQKAYGLIKVCSALRTIPDALPKIKNEEALLASLNKIFLLSGWSPETIRPDNTDDVPSISESLNTIPVNLLVESSTDTTIRVLRNIERSIRDFDIYRAAIEWGGSDNLVLQARATAYYVNESTITESNIRVSGKTGEIVKTNSGSKK